MSHGTKPTHLDLDTAALPPLSCITRAANAAGSNAPSPSRAGAASGLSVGWLASDER
jgi:hypothetical protein